MKRVLFILTALLLSCSNPVDVQDDQFILTPRPDQFYALPEKYEYTYRYKGNLYSMTETTEDIYQSDYPFYTEGEVIKKYFFDDKGYLDSVYSYNDQGKVSYKRIYKRYSEEPFNAIFYYNVYSDSSVINDSTIYVLDYNNKTKTYNGDYYSSVKKYDDYGLKIEELYIDIGIETNIYSDLGQLLESRFDAYDGDVEHRIYTYFGNSFIESIISDYDIVNDSTIRLNDTLESYEYQDFDHNGNWTKAKVKDSWYSNGEIKNYFKMVSRSYAYR